MFSLISMLVIGFVAGLIARALHPGDDKLGCVLTAGLGIAGSVVAGYLGQMLGWYRQGQAAGFIMSIVGAIIILAVYNAISKKK
ncbi:GlsB/YeaQ/YmgE family stress response membrane protein [Rappaport israeli]|uniref:GlsB/YeaQ/YmgE family stress response membrane protein n=1 Tax=Rappaport israeli TaxID=1839807 RepID=UPI00093197CD|nr:GlsB/YeaQ/YmgE family stress response membrane protein [Rappaport israeli]